MESGLDGTGSDAELDGSLRVGEPSPVEGEHRFSLALRQDFDRQTNVRGYLGRFCLFLGSRPTIEKSVGKRADESVLA